MSARTDQAGQVSRGREGRAGRAGSAERGSGGRAGSAGRGSVGRAGSAGRSRGALRRCLRAELLKERTLPALWWTVALTTGAAGLVLWSAHAAAPSGHGYGFQEVTWTWTMVVQVGFLVAGTLVATGEHTSAQGRTTLLVTPVRWRVAVARGAVVAA